MTLKESIHQVLRIQLTFRIDEIQNILEDLHLSGSRDAKSSAGDKHETGVAMAQLEQEKLRYQIYEFQKMEEIVQKINPSKCNSKINLLMN